jgi:DNA-binding transcriptional ArsR family regulator
MSNPVELWFRVSGPPTAQEAVLDLLIRNADDQFTEPQVRAELALPRSTVSVALATLVREGIVRMDRVGRSGLYSASTKDPLVRQLKIARAVRAVQIALAPVAESIDLAILFGSASRGENHAGSDVDVLIVTSETDRVSDAVAGYLWMQPIVMPSSRHMAMLAENTTLATETAKGIRILERR